MYTNGFKIRDTPDRHWTTYRLDDIALLSSLMDESFNQKSQNNIFKQKYQSPAKLRAPTHRGRIARFRSSSMTRSTGAAPRMGMNPAVRGATSSRKKGAGSTAWSLKIIQTVTVGSSSCSRSMRRAWGRKIGLRFNISSSQAVRDSL